MDRPSPADRYMSWRHSIANRFRTVFGLDLRSLAAMRIALGLVILVDLAVRGSDFTAMYSDAGFVPVNMVRGLQQAQQEANHLPSFPHWSLHLLSGASAYQAALFAAEAAAALALLVGYHTRLATIASWILVTSLQVRLPVVINAGDTLLRVLLFWSMFLPLGGAWSLDARRKPAARPMRVASIATVALIVQLAIVYWMAGAAKWNDAWLREDALHDIFSFGLYGMPVGAILARHPEITRVLSAAVVWFELLAPFLLFIPWQTAQLRMLAIVAFLLFHVGIALTVTVGLFSYVAMAAWLALLPSEFWDRQGPGAPRSERPESIVSPPSVPVRLARLLASACCLAALAVVIYWNATFITKHQLPQPVDRGLKLAAHATMLRQAWAVFGEPPRQDCWYVYQVRLKDGRQLDLLSRKRGAEHNKPALPSQQFANHRWRKLHWRLRHPSGAAYRQPLAEYICRRWNETHDADEQIVRLDLYCHCQPLSADGDEDAMTSELLAQVVLGPEGGNFAEAVRDLEGL